MPHWSWRRWFLTLVGGGLLLFLLLFGVAYATARVPKTSDIAAAQSTIITDHTGTPIARLHAEVDRVDIPFKQMPKVLRDAVVAAEDHDFYRHGGISLPSLVRAAVVDVIRGHAAQGGSTITQQYVKNAYVGNKRSFVRKIREGIVALKVERKTSKDDILEHYLNTIYFGRGAYGVQAAAQSLFGVDAQKLTPVQAAYLAGAIRAPEFYSSHPDRAKDRRDSVIDQMVGLKFLSREDADKAKKTPLKFAPKRRSIDATAAPFFVEDVRQELIKMFGEDEVYRGGLRVTTTLDRTMQASAEKAVHNTLDLPTDPDAALVSIDPHTGAIRAEVGGRDYAHNQVNVVSNSYGRQPGSSFKPFVLAAALKDGISIKSVFPAPASIQIPTGDAPYPVHNYDNADHGRLDLIHATELSVNTVYAQLISKVGPDKVVKVAHEAGINSKLGAYLSLALGTSNVTPLEMAGAYGTFASAGVYHAPYGIERVKDRKGKTLFLARQEAQNALPSGVANTVAYAMQKVIEEGTGRSANIGRPAAGKTGTTENHVDAWFGGYTPDLVTIVWMGFAEGGRTMEHVRGISVVGGSFPARIWHDFMIEALADIPPHGFPKPDFGGSTFTPSPSPSSPSPSPSSTPSATFVPTVSTTPKPSKSPNPSPSPSPTSSSSAQPSPQADPGGG